MTTEDSINSIITKFDKSSNYQEKELLIKRAKYLGFKELEIELIIKKLSWKLKII